MNQENLQALLQQASDHYAQGNLAKAGALANQVYGAQPDNHQALYILGMVANAAGRDALAVTLLQQAIALHPHHPYYHFHLGSILQGQERLERARESFEAALRLKPDFCEVHLNLGNLHFADGQFQQARECFQTAITCNPHHATSYFNLGIMAQEEGNHDEALRLFDQALQYNPDAPQTHMARAFSLLMCERFRAGWQEYEWRWRMDNLSPRVCPKPRWQGEPLHGQRIYIYTEQGFGDAIMACRYLERLQSQGARVHFECKPELYSLFAQSNLADKLHARHPDDGDPPPFDYDWHLPIMSLPGFFTETLSDIPSRIPYLSADQERIDHWRTRLHSHPGLKVGLNWSGNPRATANRHRACTLQDLYPLTGIAGIRFFSVQKGPPAEQLRFIDKERRIEDLSAELVDFAETAAVLSNLDLLVSTDTAVVHLAGALGVPTWTLLHTGSEWRWLAQREDSPWYPGMRLFRQQTPKDWHSVVQRVALALAQHPMIQK
ncbi:MAG: tetratricopeptide repeat protein [Magnetococcales bacterium]|nr:tetratricopeptide repeat protein [Magnetococcales bacterium]MBF0150296.1 tetratricopeptide repeat protein [Magnetococcales bacterium]MBF0629579.1 tetratricopeptide repeat protein [Magnetococcales bacterium]